MTKVSDSSQYSDGFDSYACNPDTWLFEARCQMAVANILFNHFQKILINSNVEERSGSYRAAMFHAGLAIENAAKAVIIMQDNSLIQKKKIDFNKFGKGGHGLVNLTRHALVTLTKQEKDLLTKLEQFVIWAGKYALPKNASHLHNTIHRQSMRLVSDTDKEIIDDLLNRLINAGKINRDSDHLKT